MKKTLIFFLSLLSLAALANQGDTTLVTKVKLHDNRQKVIAKQADTKLVIKQKRDKKTVIKENDDKFIITKRKEKAVIKENDSKLVIKQRKNKAILKQDGAKLVVKEKHGTKAMRERRKSKLVPLPAISYSPETKLTLGVIGYYFMDLAKGDTTAPMSNINLIAVYTTAKQLVLEPRFQLFTEDNKYIIRGRGFIQRFPDRHYGIGNDANVSLLTFNKDDEEQDRLNYLPIRTDRINLEANILRKVKENFHMGLNVNTEYLFNYKVLADSIHYFAGEQEINTTPVTGLRSGLGLAATYDTRDNIVNPLKGTFVNFQSLFYNKVFASDYDYSLLVLDARKYINTFKKHTLALQGVVSQRYGDEIPIRGLSRIGGDDMIRGFFRGTYQDKNMLAFQTEYRLPIWKFIGVTGFLAGGHVYDKFDELSVNDFNLAAGGGLRLCINKKERLNIRVDYGIGLSPNSAGEGAKQTGLYFFLSEAF